MAGLGIEWPVLITQFVSFALLFIILRFVAYKPLLQMLDKRSAKIKESLEQAEAVKEQSLHAEEEVKRQLQNASQKGQEIIAQATNTSDDIRARAQQLARQDAEMLIEKARQEIRSERDSAIDELRQEFVDLTITAASKVIGESLDKESHKEVINKVLRESRTVNKG